MWAPLVKLCSRATEIGVVDNFLLPPLPAEMAETQPPAETQPRAPPAAMQWTDLRRVLFDAYCDISTADIAIQRAMGTIKELLDVVQEKVSPL